MIAMPQSFTFLVAKYSSDRAEFQDSARVADSVRAASAAAAQGSPVTGVPMPTEMRTPQNVGYLEAAYAAATVVYGSYVVILFRRWSALRRRHSSGAR